MTTETTTTTTTPATFDAVSLLSSFVDQRPGLDPNDYGRDPEGWKIYRREAAEITRDRADYYDLLQAAGRLYYPEELNQLLIDYLSTTDDRLTLIYPEGKSPRLQYITGQYWPTEYRPAASRALVRLIWDKLRRNAGEEATGHDIRKAARKLLRSRRTARLYFN